MNNWPKGQLIICIINYHSFPFIHYHHPIVLRVFWLDIDGIFKMGSGSSVKAAASSKNHTSESTFSGS
jgi:hypothetical protein